MDSHIRLPFILKSMVGTGHQIQHSIMPAGMVDGMPRQAKTWSEGIRWPLRELFQSNATSLRTAILVTPVVGIRILVST